MTPYCEAQPAGRGSRTSATYGTLPCSAFTNMQPPWPSGLVPAGTPTGAHSIQPNLDRGDPPMLHRPFAFQQAMQREHHPRAPTAVERNGVLLWRERAVVPGTEGGSSSGTDSVEPQPPAGAVAVASRGAGPHWYPAQAMVQRSPLHRAAGICCGRCGSRCERAAALLVPRPAVAGWRRRAALCVAAAWFAAWSTQRKGLHRSSRGEHDGPAACPGRKEEVCSEAPQHVCSRRAWAKTLRNPTRTVRSKQLKSANEARPGPAGRRPPGGRRVVRKHRSFPNAQLLATLITSVHHCVGCGTLTCKVA